MGGLITCLAANLCECAFCLGCQCCSTLTKCTLDQMARLGHLLVYISVFITAVVLGREFQANIAGNSSVQYYHVSVSNSLQIKGLYDGCNMAYYDDCVYRQLVYRASCCLFIYFAIMGVLCSFSEYMNRSFWPLKFFFAGGLFMAFWYGSNDFFSGWAEFARALSFFWLLVQGLLLLDLAHDVHDIMAACIAQEDTNSNSTTYHWQAIYLVICLAFWVMTGVGLGFLFEDYADCELGKVFLAICIVNGLLQTLTSVSSSVLKGLLTPSILFAYGVFMVWYALLSCPQGGCNPAANTNDNDAKDSSMAIISGVFFVILLFCMGMGAKILQIFSVEGEGVISGGTNLTNVSGTTDPIPKKSNLNKPINGDQKSIEMSPTNSRSPSEIGFANDNSEQAEPNLSASSFKERMFFHFLMALASCYGGMILTSWGKSDGSPENVGNLSYTGSESMWLKIIAQWILSLLYWRALQVAYTDNQL